MSEVIFDCDCESVMEMERRGIGVEEILQYAKSILPRKDILALVECLERLLAGQRESDNGSTRRGR